MTLSEQLPSIVLQAILTYIDVSYLSEQEFETDKNLLIIRVNASVVVLLRGQRHVTNRLTIG